MMQCLRQYLEASDDAEAVLIAHTHKYANTLASGLPDDLRDRVHTASMDSSMHLPGRVFKDHHAVELEIEYNTGVRRSWGEEIARLERSLQAMRFHQEMAESRIAELQAELDEANHWHKAAECYTAGYVVPGNGNQ